MRVALIQMTASDDPGANLVSTLKDVRTAASEGAALVLTPEVTNCVSASRARQQAVLQRQDDDATLAALRDLAAELGVWLNIGSLALKTDDPDGRFANRSFLIAPDGRIAAWYDKIHMFDVVISDTESYRESAGYRPGDRAVLARTDIGAIGLTVCYDMRFPSLYRQLSQAGAQILLAPSAFSPVTGAAHWESLLRARAIECGAYVLAAAQCGSHPATEGKARRTWGHSLAVSPWGEVLYDGGDGPGIGYVDVDLAQVDDARGKVPSLQHDRDFGPPA
ncbi:MAG: amidohydrolase [Maritimibacter sp.]|nr:amidohydrolase [Maritimibacter sp.]